ncbi:MAG: HlyD family efflux transporter periplasmic adaptor subunit [Burkholderiaceae bacterium]|nr:HlyD family efflux transporter periplasmic adaptor subunit [Burkholderiaceae bacterium]MDO9089395.1 HlyD family efflux transporter periplasmic adaptor subunit [Burkholderiaceae bacterium]
MKQPAPQPTERLFRHEVLEAQSTKLLGQILLTPRVSTFWASLLCALAALAIIAFLVLGSYTRRATVNGRLLPSSGVIRIYTPQAGVIHEKRVIEGQVVAKGEVLYVLSSDRVGANGARELQADIARQVDERRRSMEAEIARNRSMEATETSHLERRGATLRSEIQATERLIEQQRSRLALAEDARKRYQGLAEKDYIAKEQFFQKEVELSEQQSRLQTLQRDLLVAQRELATTEQEIRNTRARYANQNSVLQRSISSAGQELTEVEARRQVVVTAPEAGRATLVTGEVGQNIDLSRPLLDLVPVHAQLNAVLYAPSRTIGFVRKGDKVLLRYQSFPYQKFGQHEGVVQSVSFNAVPSTELAGIALTDLTPGEPVYAITVALKQQSVKTYGEERPLQAGMRLEADVLQETRKLYEWMLEPLYSITGKM